MPGLNDVPYLTNSSMMDVDFLPHHLIIVGGSYIGLDGCRRVQAAISAVIYIRFRDRRCRPAGHETVRNPLSRRKPGSTPPPLRAAER
jgi:pyruvate/2-oxoglutarate dehydrogenase complex dihydrolipoamide dehydrogenase (E3) component